MLRKIRFAFGFHDDLFLVMFMKRAVVLYCVFHGNLKFVPITTIPKLVFKRLFDMKFTQNTLS